MSNPGLRVIDTFSETGGNRRAYELRSPRHVARTFTVTLAEVNAGRILIPASELQSDERFVLTNWQVRVTGTWSAGTSIVLRDTHGTPIDLISIGQLALSGGAVIHAGSANVTNGNPNGLNLGQGVQVVRTGSNFTGGTSVEITLIGLFFEAV